MHLSTRMPNICKSHCIPTLHIMQCNTIYSRLLTNHPKRYSLHTVATELGMTSLSQQCLMQLYNETDAMIQAAISNGISLGQLLDLTSKPEDKPGQSPLPENMVQVVFSHVLKDTKSHQRLVDLVVTRLAEHLDLGLLEKLARTIGLGISILIIKAMVQLRQVKTEDSTSLGLK
jgi:hypothetical protein